MSMPLAVPARPGNGRIVRHGGSGAPCLGVSFVASSGSGTRAAADAARGWSR